MSGLETWAPPVDEAPGAKELQERVAAEVRSQLQKELEALKGTAEFALKIVGAAFALFVAVFALFGLTTWQDIKKETSAFVHASAEALIQKGDADTNVKEVLNDLVNRTLLNAALSSIARNEDDAIDLSKNEWDRLRTWAKSETLDDADFGDVLTVLNSQDQNRKKADAASFLSEMLSHGQSTDSFEWIGKQPAKRLAIMTRFFHPDMGASAMRLILNADVSYEMRLAAVRYVRRLNYVDGFEKLIKLVGEADGELKRELLVSCAAFRPNHPLFAEEVKRLLASPVGEDSLTTIAGVVGGMWSRTHKPESDAEARAIELGKQLLKFLVKHDVSFGYSGRNGLVYEIDDSLGGITGVTLWSPNGMETALSWREFRDLKPYWLLLSEAANKSDETGLTALLPTLAGGRIPPQHRIQVTLGDSSSIAVKIRTRAARFEPYVLTRSNTQEIALAPSVYLYVHWKDASGNAGYGLVSDFVGGDFDFALPPSPARMVPAG